MITNDERERIGKESVVWYF